MSIIKKIEIDILNFKFLLEHLELIEAQLVEGTEDLQFRLSHFRKKVKEKEKFDLHFFGIEKQHDTDVVLKKSEN